MSNLMMKVYNNQADLGKVVGTPERNEELGRTLMDQNVKIMTADGAWIKEVFLPAGNTVPPSSTVEVGCRSGWPIIVHWGEGMAPQFVKTNLDLDFVNDENERWIMKRTIQGPEALKPDAVSPQALEKLFNGYKHLKILTQNGAWIENIHLPQARYIPDGSTMKFRCESAWGVNIRFQGINEKVDQNREIDLVTVKDQWLAKHTARGQKELDLCVGERTNTECINKHLEMIFNHKKTKVEVRTWDGCWTKHICLPMAEKIPEGSVLELTVKSGWPVHIFDDPKYRKEQTWTVQKDMVLRLRTNNVKRWEVVDSRKCC